MTEGDAPSVGADLAIRAQPVLPMAPDQARQVMAAYQEMCKAILTADDVQRVGDREFTKRSGFQKLAAGYGVSTEIISVDVKGTKAEAESGGEMIARAVVRAIHPSGRHADGDGACSSNERRFARGDEKMDHSLPATAVTRATNRAVSNLIAFGTVSAEEAEGTMGAAPAGGSGRAPAWAAPVNVGTAAEALHLLLDRAGVPTQDRHKIVTRVGNLTLDECDGQFPKVVFDIVVALADELLLKHVEEELDATEVTTDTTDTTEKE